METLGTWFSMPFSQWLEEARGRKGWSQRELARQVSLSRTTVNRLELGKLEPDLETAYRLFYALDDAPQEVLAVLQIESVDALKKRRRGRVMLNVDDLSRALDVYQPVSHQPLYQYLEGTLQRVHDRLEHAGTAPSLAPYTLTRRPYHGSILDHPGDTLPNDAYITLVGQVATEEGALTMNDVGYYMRALRMIQNVSLAKMRKRMGGILSVPRMSTMERGEVQSMGLMQALEWATALQEVNQIFKAFWLATEVGVVVADVASEREAAARRKAAETIVTLWRWEQVLFASPDWVTDFRRVVDESADESA